MLSGFSCQAQVDGIISHSYVLGASSKERFMRPISGFIFAALAVLALAGCSTTAADNTTYARPPVSSGGVAIPLN
jgi:hypothetical protein